MGSYYAEFQACGIRNCPLAPAHLERASRNHPCAQSCARLQVSAPNPKSVCHLQYFYAAIFHLTCCLLCITLLRLFVSIPVWWGEDMQEEKGGFVRFSCTACAYTLHANRHTCTRVFYSSVKTRACLTHTHTHTQRHFEFQNSDNL